MKRSRVRQFVERLTAWRKPPMTALERRLWSTWGPHPEDYTPEAWAARWNNGGIKSDTPIHL
jgi:hypothetical protein